VPPVWSVRKSEPEARWLLRRGLGEFVLAVVVGRLIQNLVEQLHK
jgi:hypothetical protein